ncbi:putative integral membrane protein [Cryptosporidium felis]|nr:putative integral membrane protein [Cryptosporidium felis]
MTTTRRRGLEEKKSKMTPSRSAGKAEEDELGQIEALKEKLSNAVLLLKSQFPAWGLVVFWFFSALESSFFYIYLTIFSPFLRPFIFEGQAHKMLMTFLGSQNYFPLLQRYQVISRIDQVFDWLSTWDQTNQVRFLAFSASFVFGYMIYRGYEVCPTYSMVNYQLGKYPSFGIMMGSIIASTIGGIFGGYLLFYFGSVHKLIPDYLLEGLKYGDYRQFPLSSFFGEAFLSFLYSLGVSIVCRVGPGFFGAAEISWFSNANIGSISNLLRAPGNLSLTYSALYGAYSGDYIGATILGTANIAGTLLMNLLLALKGSSGSKKNQTKRKNVNKSKHK